MRSLAVLGVLVGLGIVAANAAAALQAAFDCSPSCTVPPGTTVTFTSTSTSSSEIRNHEWDLDGDGLYGAFDEPDEPYGTNTSSTQRAFPDQGSFQVGLRVTNRDGEESTTSRTVTVASTPEPPQPPGEPPPPPDPLPPPGNSDLDDDGVAFRLDACPGTPGRKRMFWRGCTAADLVGGAGLVSDPALTQLADAGRLIRKEGGFGRPRKRIARAFGLIDAAAAALERGKPCNGASAYGSAMRQLTLAKSGLRSGFLTRRRKVARRLKPGADVSPQAMGIAMLELKRELAGDAIADARHLRAAFTGPCRALGGKFTVRDRVLEIDDAAGIIRLSRGKLLVIPGDVRPRGPAAEGAVVRATGVNFKDGTGLVEGLTASPGKGDYGLEQAPCLSLRIAPVQPFPPWVPSATPTLHSPEAYRHTDDRLLLEREMRVAVMRTGCSDDGPGRTTLRYSVRLRETSGSNDEILAHSLEDGDTPVPLGVVKAAQQGIRLFNATTYVRACKPGETLRSLCSQAKAIESELIPFRLRNLHSRATAQYSSTSFGTKDNDLFGDTENAVVTGLDLKEGAENATEFQASGYQLENGAPSRPETRLVELGEPFLIYADDIYDPEDVFAHFKFGTEQASGLTWPRVVGKRNGRTFWYSAALPRIVRDRIPSGVCPEIPPFILEKGPPNPDPDDKDGFFPPPAAFVVTRTKDSYYKLPFPQGFTPGSSSTLNIDDPNPAGRHGDSQPYAYDLLAPQGTPVLAARSGVVRLMEDDDPYNKSQAPAGWTKIGNFVWVQHEDGTIASYNHHKKDTALVTVGQEVRRGQQLAQSGNTGQSSTPHLHFEVFHKNSLDFAIVNDLVKDERARFEALTGSNQAFDPCYIPRNGETFSSTNALPLGD